MWFSYISFGSTVYITIAIWTTWNFRDCKHLRMLMGSFLVSRILSQIPVYIITIMTLTLSNGINKPRFWNLFNKAIFWWLTCFYETTGSQFFYNRKIIKSQQTREGAIQLLEAVISSASGQMATFRPEVLLVKLIHYKK